MKRILRAQLSQLFQARSITSSTLTFSLRNHFSSVQPAVEMTGTTTENGKEAAPLLTQAILRYQPGGERFQFTFTFSGKKFNFDRAATELTSSFLERLRTNLSKKVMKLKDTTLSTKLISAEEEHDGDPETDKFPLSIILEKVFSSNSALSLQVGTERILVDLNPPEVTKLAFLKQAFVGFPILPVRLEATNNFVQEGSKFVWEFRKVRPSELNDGLRKRRKSSVSDVWTPCHRSGSNTNNSMIYTPDETLVDSVLRLTCVPWDGSRFGIPFSNDTASVSLPPVTNHLFSYRASRMGPKPGTSGSFRMVSYNALADLACTPEWFKTSPKEALSIDYRLPLLNRELVAYEGDLLCLQEIDQKYYESNFNTFLGHEAGLRGLFHCKDGDTREGLATFYNPSKFTLLETNRVVLKDYMLRLPFSKTFSQLESLLERIADRNTVLQVSVFEFNAAPGSLLIVANTHLYFKPDADHIRTLQSMTCLSYIESKVAEYKVKGPGGTTTVLFCGDFNCTPPYGSYRLITGGRIHENDVDWTQHETEKLIPGPMFQHNLDLVTSHPAQELTSLVSHFDGCIDYIFYQPKGLKLNKIHPPPSKAQIGELLGIEESKVTLPTFQAPSDHLPLIADFALI